jgi:hypothetical protein
VAAGPHFVVDKPLSIYADVAYPRGTDRHLTAAFGRPPPRRPILYTMRPTQFASFFYRRSQRNVSPWPAFPLM